jgi:alpha-D-ribose 1-methylphosphonate 5-triphosphate synthase subunit PhnL
MCFSLYAGTVKPLTRKAWDKDIRGLSVSALDQRDAHIISYFNLPEVQRIGSTAGCGCDFPYVTLTKGAWVGYPEVIVDDPGWEKTELVNREALVAMLIGSGEKMIELYGIWQDGESEKPVNVREEISLKRILDSDFRFKERGFYTVNL